VDGAGTTIAVQQKGMRHADIYMTMNIYCTVLTDEMSTASGKESRLELTARVTARVTARTRAQVIENMAERVGFETIVQRSFM